MRRQRELRLGRGASEPRVSAQQFMLRAAPSRVHCVARFLRSPAREAICRCCSCCVFAECVRICADRHCRARPATRRFLLRRWLRHIAPEWFRQRAPGSRRKSPSSMCSTVTRVVFEACAIVISSRCTPIHTLPWLSALSAWNSVTSGRIAGRMTIGSRVPLSASGLSITFQSGRTRSRSDPTMPRRGMNGTPFSAACRPAWIAGQVASHISISPDLMAAVKRGATHIRRALRRRPRRARHSRRRSACRPGSRPAARRRYADRARPGASVRAPRTWRSRNNPPAARCVRRSGCARPALRR